MYLNAMSHEEAIAEAYHNLGYGPLDTDSLEILAKLTREGFRVECEADYPYQPPHFLEADGSEDLHAISLMLQRIEGE